MGRRVWMLGKPTCVILASCILFAPVASLAGQPAAVIVDYDGAASIIGARSGTAMEFQLGSVLEEGDHLDIPDSGFVKLNRGGSCGLLLSPDTSRSEEPGCSTSRVSSYSVPSSGLTDDVSSRYQQLAEILGWWDPERKSKPMRSRESYGLRVPALDNVAKPLLVAGGRTLEVRWVDGKPPFRLKATTSDGKQVEGIVAEGARTGSVHVFIEPGKTFRLEVADASKSVSYKVYGIAAFEDKKVAMPLDDYDRASQIVSSISMSGGDWAFEGVQQIKGLALEPRVKTALTSAIEYGDWP
ncbi:hypothetical protein [Rhizobium sp. BG4]|uniref:hypothetical protein n=1 Tax=Rhizobium sp. BG4 TaxID=2613770 RepID=UPI00193DD2CA|nr:hypothetical protein [Rhizobium sp. BG4]QRM45768.1 hypothetical protein F2982_20280 [Rhizobium sp. BG4]